MRNRHLWLGLAMGLTLSGVAQATDADYGSAFGNDLTEAAAKAEPQAVTVTQDAAAPLREVGSFPVRVRRGERASLEWTDEERLSYAPQRIVKKFRAGKCEFQVSTGDLGLTRYETLRDSNEVAVETDPVLRFSTLKVSESKGLLVSISAELFVSPLPGKEAACKEKFQGRKVRFGKVDMGLTQLALEKEGEPEEISADVFQPRDETFVYLSWNADSGRLELSSKGGLPPAVESPVFRIHPKSEGDYYLTVSPKLAIHRVKKR